MDQFGEISRSNSAFKRASLLLLCAVGWLTCSVAQVEKYLPLRHSAVVCALGCVFVAGLLLLLQWSYRRGLDLPRWSLAALLLTTALSFAVLYPKSLHREGRNGSDREDALRVELVAVTHHQYPYDARTFRNNRPTPLPGALWLAAPFYFLGHIALQNLVWLAIWFVIFRQFFTKRSTLFAFALIFLLLSLENLNDIDVGGDYITNFLYVAVAIFLFTRAVERRISRWISVLSVALLGVAISSRIIYVVVLIPLLSLSLQKTSKRRTVLMFAGVLGAALLATLPVFWPHPITRVLHQLAQNSDKFAYLPVYFSSPVLAGLSMLAACVSFRLRMSLERVYLISGVATCIMLVPPMASIVAEEGGLFSRLTPDLEYLAVGVMFVNLWVFSRWERMSLPSADVPAR